MSLLNTIETDIANTVTTTEDDVKQLIVDIHNGIGVATNTITNAVNWIKGELPAVEADLQWANTVAGELGLTSNPTVSAALSTAFTEVSNISNIVNGTNVIASVQSLVSAFVGLANAQAATKKAIATVASSAPGAA